MENLEVVRYTRKLSKKSIYIFITKMWEWILTILQKIICAQQNKLPSDAANGLTAGIRLFVGCALEYRTDVARVTVAPPKRWRRVVKYIENRRLTRLDVYIGNIGFSTRNGDEVWGNEPAANTDLRRCGALSLWRQGVLHTRISVAARWHRGVTLWLSLWMHSEVLYCIWHDTYEAWIISWSTTSRCIVYTVGRNKLL